MTATELIDHCRDRDVRLFAGVDGKLRHDAPQGAVSPWLAAELSNHTAEVLELLGSLPLGSSQEPSRPAAVATKGRICRRCKSPDLVVSFNVPPPHYAKLMCVRCARFVDWLPKPASYDPNWKWPLGKKHRDRTLAEIAENDREYLEWVTTWEDEPRIRERVAYFLDHIGHKPAAR